MVTVKGVELLIAEFERNNPTDGFMSVTIALMFFFTVYVLEMVGKGVWFRPSIRGFLSDYAYPVCLLSIFKCIAYLDSTDRYNTLDGVRPLSRSAERDKRQQITTHAGFLSHRRSGLAHRFLEPGS